MSPTLVKPTMYFPTNECFSAVGDGRLVGYDRQEHISTDFVSDDYMSLDSIRGASIPLNDPGFLRPSNLFYREEHSHKAHL